MILEIDDAREIELPDAMSDETARQIKALILATEQRAQQAEQRAQAAESEVRMLRDEMTAMRSHVGSVQTKQADNSGVMAAIQNMHTETVALLRKVYAATSADREMVPNEYGEMTRSKAIL